ncbi:MAG: DMT family protein, partial [Firmicutes bacterium]|nr:DMT family protein [Bacillota bacterium]
MCFLLTFRSKVISNIFMTFAWYGHLKMKQTFSWFDSLPL